MHWRRKMATQSKELLDEGERGEWKSCLKTQHSKNEDHGIWPYNFMANRWGKSRSSDTFYLGGGGSKITVDGHCSHKIEMNVPLRKAMTNLDSIFKSRDIILPTKVHIVQAMVFPVVMYGCENRTIKKAEHWRINAFKSWCWRRLESPSDSKDIQSVNPKINQTWIFIGRTDPEFPILWPLDVKSQLNAKDPDLGKDWGQEEKRVTEDEVIR